MRKPKLFVLSFAGFTLAVAFLFQALFGGLRISPAEGGALSGGAFSLRPINKTALLNSNAASLVPIDDKTTGNPKTTNKENEPQDKRMEVDQTTQKEGRNPEKDNKTAKKQRDNGNDLEESNNERKGKIKQLRPREETLHQNTKKGEKMLPPLRVCHQESGALQIPQRDIGKNVSFALEYQCAGPDYDSFGQALQKFAHHHTNQSGVADTWGRRPTPLPDHAAVLWIGNSHTKQMIVEFLCQYAEQIVEYRPYPFQGDYSGGLRGYSVHFANNASVYLHSNGPAEFSKNWTQTLERYVQRPLHSFQAFVLGQFNGVVREQTYWNLMMKMQSLDSDLDFVHAQRPNVTGVAAAFQGPIVFVSSFKPGDAASAARTIQTEIPRLNRTNVQGIRSRQYTPSVYNGRECAARGRYVLGTCGLGSPMGNTAHPCTGLNGGHPTLIAHDVREALFSMIGEN